MDPKNVIGKYFALRADPRIEGDVHDTPQAAIPRFDLARNHQYGPGDKFVVFKAVAVVQHPHLPIEVVEGKLND
jgi:hypothetical protein